MQLLRLLLLLLPPPMLPPVLLAPPLVQRLQQNPQHLLHRLPSRNRFDS